MNYDRTGTIARLPRAAEPGRHLVPADRLNGQQLLGHPAHHARSGFRHVQKEVRGDIVVAIPTRHVLVATGSDDREGIERMKQIVQRVSAQGSYRLTRKLFVRRAGKFDEFTGDAGPDPSPKTR